MQVLYFCSDSHWKNIIILPHFSPYGQSSKTKSGMELAFFVVQISIFQEDDLQAQKCHQLHVWISCV